MSLREQTLIREQAAELEFWKARALQLSEAVTALSERLEATTGGEEMPPADPQTVGVTDE